MTISSINEKAVYERLAEGIKAVIRNRGYTPVSAADEGDKIEVLGEKKEKRKKIKVVAWLPKVKTIGVKFVRDLKKSMEERKIHHGFLLTVGKYTHYTRKEVTQNENIELIPAAYAFFDIFTHDLVPEHEIVPKEEVERIVKEYGIQVNQLSMLKASDPVARAIGARVGDVVKITRKSPTAGVSIAFRYVIN